MVISPIPAVSNWAERPGSNAKMRRLREDGSGIKSFFTTGKSLVSPTDVMPTRMVPIPRRRTSYHCYLYSGSIPAGMSHGWLPETTGLIRMRQGLIQVNRSPQNTQAINISDDIHACQQERVEDRSKKRFVSIRFRLAAAEPWITTRHSRMRVLACCRANTDRRAGSSFNLTPQPSHGPPTRGLFAERGPFRRPRGRRAVALARLGRRGNARAGRRGRGDGRGTRLRRRCGPPRAGRPLSARS